MGTKYVPRVGIYNRCSTEEEAQINALSIQAAESREKAKALGFEIADQYIESESGTSTRGRTEYQRMLGDMERGKFDIIMIKSIDRLMRSARDWYLFLEKLTQFNIQLYIYIDNKYYTPEDNLITGIKAILAEDFSRELSKKIKNAHARRQEKKSGLNITAPMFGWDKIRKDEYRINEEEAGYYRMAFALAKEGKGFYSIANIMYELGARSKRGARISQVQWRNMLLSPRAHGTVVLNTKEQIFGTKKRKPVPEEKWIYVEHALPPIISEEYHREILQILEDRQKQKSTFQTYTRDLSKVGRHILSNRLYCAECGQKYYRCAAGGKKGCRKKWKCSTAMTFGTTRTNPSHGCDNMVVEEERILGILEKVCKEQFPIVFERSGDIEDQAMQLLQKMLQGGDRQKELEKLKKEREKQKRRKEILLQKLMDELIEDADFTIQNNRLNEQISELTEKIVRISQKNVEYNDYEKRIRNIKNFLREEQIIDKAKVRKIITGIDRIWLQKDQKLRIEFAPHPYDSGRIQENRTVLVMDYL